MSPVPSPCDETPVTPVMTASRTGPQAAPVLADCGCRGFQTSRRAFLQGAFTLAGAGVLTSVTGRAFTQVALADTGTARNILVVLSLRGGADGLSLVVPHGDPNYVKARDGLLLPAGRLLAADDMFGLHPNFRPLLPMWEAGEVAAVHAVGLPKPNRSHFAAMEEIEDADPGSELRRGWLNRLIGLNERRSSLEAVQMGSPLVPVSLYGSEPVLAVGDIDDMALAGPEDPDAYERRVKSLQQVWGPAEGVLGRGGRSAIEVSEILTDIPDLPAGEEAYPVGDLGRALAQTVRLIRAEVGTEVVAVDYGSWDMHAGLGDLDGGLMLGAVDELAQALRAFFADLGGLASRVTVVTVTEFGRRVTPNASRGLDHGYASVMLLAGAGVRGGKYYGQWPGLGPGSLVDGDLAVTRDYRSVLSEVVRSRFDVDVSQVFPDFTPEPIGVMRG